MKTRDEQYGWASAIVWIIKFLIGLFTGAAKRKKDQEIEAAKDELKKALAEGRTTDAAYWLRKLKQLTGAIALLAVLLFQGCFTPSASSASTTGSSHRRTHQQGQSWRRH